MWSRSGNLLSAQNWLDTNTSCRDVILGGRCGWRIPSIEELSSLVDPSRTDPALTDGHPFVDVQFGDGVPAYWTRTNSENGSGAAWFVNMGAGRAGLGNKTISRFAWPVRG